uniref:Putative secreted protein n=1 Tax=Anopheles darlingi TaxID=43151 RepID=A0A2M4D5B7_ANODA
MLRLLGIFFLRFLVYGSFCALLSLTQQFDSLVFTHTRPEQGDSLLSLPHQYRVYWRSRRTTYGKGQI